MQRIIIGNAPFSNTPLPSSFMPATDNRPLLYMTSKLCVCDVMIPTKKSGDGQAKFHQSFLHFTENSQNQGELAPVVSRAYAANEKT
jgi:hypothetical protein